MHGLRRWLAATLVVSISGTMQVPSALADQRTDARREYRAGMQSLADGRYDEGITHLEAAYDILPHPNVLYNLGLAHMYAGRSEEAIEYFERFKETAPPSDAAEIETLIASLRGKQEAVAAAQVTQSEAGGKGDAASAVETAAREVRRMAEETKSEALLRQAEQLEATAKAMREGQPLPDKGTTPSPAETPTPAPVGKAGKDKAGEGAYEEQVVSASRFAQSPLDAPNATAIITAQDIRMSGLTNIGDLLRRVAGVEMNQVTPVQSEISIRGLNRRQSNKVLFLVDGRSQRLDFLGTSWWNATPYAVEQIERIEVIRGPASALYGADAFSGIVNVVTKKPGEGEQYMSGQYGSNGIARAAAGFNARNGRFAYRYNFGYGQSENAAVPVGPDRIDVAPLNNRQDSAYKAGFANGELRYDIAKNSEAVLGGYAYFGDNTIQGLSRLGQVTSPDSWRTSVYGTVTTPVGIRVSSRYDIAAGGAGASFTTPGAIDVYGGNLRQDVADTDISWSGNFKLGVPQNVTVGAGYIYKKINWDWIDKPHQQHHFSGYVQDVAELTRTLKLQLGARVDQHPLLNGPQFSPRGSLVYRFLEDQSLRLSIGRAFRGPSFLESYVDLPNSAPLRGVTGLGLGNDKLDPESIVSYEIGYQNQASDYFSLEANVYFNTVKDAILFTDIQRYTLQDFNGGNPYAVYNPAIGAFPVSSIGFTNERATFRQLGSEVGVRVFPVAGLDVYTNYSIHETTPLDKDRDKIDPIRRKEQQTSLHKINAGVQYRARFGLDAALDLSWFSNQVWIEQVTDIDRGVRFATFSQPSFTMLNGRIGYRLFNDRLDLGVVATNLVDRNKRQHPFGQPIDTRVFGSAKLRF